MIVKRMSIMVLMASICFLSRANEQGIKVEGGNPLLSNYNTPFETPPFDKIKDEHFLPAFEKSLALMDAEIQAIASSDKKPSFENTIEALERSGSMLNRVSYLFSNMLGACPSQTLTRIAVQVFPLLSRHEDAVMMNASLFRRVRAVYEMKNDLKLNEEQKTLLEKTFRQYVRAGALLDEAHKAELKRINEDLSRLTETFGDHLSSEKNAFYMLLNDKKDLSGLPEDVVSGAAETAKEMGHQGTWAFTLQGPSLVPFLRYSKSRHLREKLYKAAVGLGSQDNEFNNESIVVRITNLRARKAHILGYRTYAHYVLEENMAKSPEAVYGLLNDIWTPALEKAKKEAQELQAFMDREGGNAKLEPWDWAFYVEQMNLAKNILDEQKLKPYFKLENVRDGAFYVAHKLFGLTFKERLDIPRYHKDVQVFEVKDADGSNAGVLYLDYLERAGKMYAGYMNYYRRESRRDGHRIAPIVCNVEKFSKVAGHPVLLSLDEVKILFHEFGHALHELLSQCSYETLSGTNTAKDFVEMPSRFMERWALQPDVLRVYARHYQTGETIPEDLINKIQIAIRMNQGYDVVGFAASSFLDMDWHTLEDVKGRKCREFEKATLDRIGLIPEIDPRYRSTYFMHIFDGSYSASYYSYLWSEVLAADAFEVFQKAGLYNRETATSFRKNILEKGGSEEAGILFKRFRGGTLGIGPFLKARGLLGTGG